MKRKYMIWKTVEFTTNLRAYINDTSIFSEMDEKYKKLYLIGQFLAFLACVLSFVSNKD